MMKDINIGRKVADDVDLDLPLSSAAQRLWADIQAQAPADASLSELVRTLETRTGIELKPRAAKL